MIRKIITTKNPKLRLVSKEVKKIDKKVKDLITDLKDTLKSQKDPEGVGLAAPQIAVNLRVFLASYKNFKRVVINPEIISTSQKTHTTKHGKNEVLEGCLSLPNYYGPLKRSATVEIKYLNEKGESVTEKFKDFEAQIMLHEIDHLDGILFVDRLLEQKKKLYRVIKDKWEEIELI